MTTAIKLTALLATAWFGIMTNASAADDIIFGSIGNGCLVAYDARDALLVVFGDENDNRIEVAQADDGGLLLNGRQLDLSGLRLTFKNTAAVAIHGGAGNDVIIANYLPQVAMCGGKGEDLLIWNNSDGEFRREYYGEDLLVWNSSDGGAGLDVLIGNTAGDRSWGDLGNDWIVGGTGVDGAYGGWGNDLLQADDVLNATGGK